LVKNRYANPMPEKSRERQDRQKRRQEVKSEKEGRERQEKQERRDTIKIKKQETRQEVMDDRQWLKRILQRIAQNSKFKRSCNASFITSFTGEYLLGI
jgi:Skp family chaperone for outer membrane proteins